MRTPHTYRVGLVLAAGILAACDDVEPTNPGSADQFARVQFINASSSTATTDVLLNGNTVQSGLGFQQASTSCVLVPVGSRTLTFQSGGTAVANTGNFTFQPGGRYTVLLTGTGATRTATVLPDLYTAPATGQTAVRFVNATGTAGDVFFTTPTGTPSGTPTVANLAPGQATGGTTGANAFTGYASTNTRARLYNVGATSGARSDATLTAVPTGSATTVVFTPQNGLLGPTAFQVNQCT